MNTNNNVEKSILNMILKIHREFPELSKYIAEMPVKIARTDGMNDQSFKEYYNSLEKLVKEYSETHERAVVDDDSEKANLPGYPIYPASEDIYNKAEQEMNLNPENISKKKAPNDEEGTLNEKGFENHMSGSDLDIPGSELDDQQERVGSEDEENNYYSLGGDNHNDLEEDRG